MPVTSSPPASRLGTTDAYRQRTTEDAQGPSTITASSRPAATSTVLGVESNAWTKGAPGVGSMESLPPRRAVINGFAGQPMPKLNATLNPNPGQQGTTEKKDPVAADGWTARGFIDVRFQPAVDGVNIQVETHHARPRKMEAYAGDPMVMYLQARVLDGPRERIITLSTLFDGVANTDRSPTSQQRFFVSYSDINAWLKSKNPNLQFVPGDPLAVQAVWKDAGHLWGGFCRGGYFESPQPLGRLNAVAVRNGAGTAGAVPAVQKVEYVDKPIDITLRVPEELVKQYNLVLDQDAKLVSRREHEQKFSLVSLDQLRSATRALLAVCQGREEEREQWLLTVFGADGPLSAAAGHDVSGWHIKTTDRYYTRDDAGRVKMAGDGLPVVAPMVDAYQDNLNGRYESLSVARANMAVRFRDGEIKSGESVGSMGKLNMKTTRITDPFTLTQTGLEFSLDTRFGISSDPAALDQLAQFLSRAPAPYSPLPELKRTAPCLSAEDVTHEAVVNVANRYKFTLEHDNGMELEASLDVVHAGIVCLTANPSQTIGMTEEQKYNHYATLVEAQDPSVLVSSSPTLKTGVNKKNQVVQAEGEQLVMAQLWVDDQGNKHVSEHPCYRFPQVEVEMDHVQARTTGAVVGAYTRPTQTSTLTDDEGQDIFLRSVSAQATMNGPPIIHSLDDLHHPELYASRDYQQMQDAVVRFREGVFPTGVKPARQKAATALELAGLIPAEETELIATFPQGVENGDVKTGYSAERNTILLVGNKLGGLPVDLSVEWNGFPIRLPLKGTETADEVGQALGAVLDQAVLFKASVQRVTDNFRRSAVAVTVSPRD